MDRLLSRIRDFEDKSIQYNLEDPDDYEYRTGRLPILISAPHGARHWRNNKWKQEDEYTSSLAVILAERTESHVIFVKNATREDPNHL